ncbi:MAG: hypothetical protein ABII85_01870 [Bacillota bacterium]
MKLVIKNYKETGEKVEGCPVIKVRYDDEDVFFDLPQCLCAYGVKLKKPVLLVENGKPFAVEADVLIKRNAETKIFHLDLVDPEMEDEKPVRGSVKETDEKTAPYHPRLPKNINIDELKYDRGRFYLPRNKAVQNTGKIEKRAQA